MKIAYHESKGDFGIEVKFEDHARNPRAIFASISELIGSLEEIDLNLSALIAHDLLPELRLEGLEAGSLWMWFASVLRQIPDEALKELSWQKIIGSFLVRIKISYLKWAEKRETVNSLAEVEPLQKEITLLKNEVEDHRFLPLKTPVPMGTIILLVKRLSDALVLLPPGQSLTFVSASGAINVNPTFQISDEQVLQLLTHSSKTNHARLKLTIKKPDYLGSSMWDVVAMGRTKSVKIEDNAWLDSFHKRRVALLPGDALFADVRIDVHLDEDGKPIDTKITVERVLAVVKADDGARQLECFDDDGSQ